MTTITQHDVDAAGLRHYAECGSGEPVLLLHGWPTSSFLWRNVMPAIAAAGARAIALDVPGFGDSDKPLDVRYGFRFFNKVLIPTLDVPVRVIYGEKDILPGVAKTMHRVARDVPHAQLSALAGSGHFLQEDRPAELGRMLGDFFAARSESLAS